MSARLPELSYFCPAYNEAENIEALVAEALVELPKLADRFEIIVVDDGSRDATPEISDRLAAAHPEVRVVHHRPNRGYGGALRSGFEAARFAWVAFTDGDRQFRIADIARLIEAADADPQLKAVVGFRIKRADPFVRTAYARTYRLALRLFYGLDVTDVDCAAKLFRTESLRDLRVASDGAFFSAELLIRFIARHGRRNLAEVGIPHHARPAGSPTGAKLSVIGRAITDFWRLRLLAWRTPDAWERHGTPLVADAA